MTAGFCAEEMRRLWKETVLFYFKTGLLYIEVQRKTRKYDFEIQGLANLPRRVSERGLDGSTRPVRRRDDGRISSAVGNLTRLTELLLAVRILYCVS